MNLSTLYISLFTIIYYYFQILTCANKNNAALASATSGRTLGTTVNFVQISNIIFNPLLKRGV